MINIGKKANSFSGFLGGVTNAVFRVVQDKNAPIFMQYLNNYAIVKRVLPAFMPLYELFLGMYYGNIMKKFLENEIPDIDYKSY